MISVIISNFNGSKKIQKTLKSILNQSFQDFEILISDDGSDDDSKEILSQISKKDPRVKLFFNNYNIGLTKNLIRLIDNAKYDLIARQDVGDFSEQDRLKKQIEFFNKNKYHVLCGTNGKYYNETKNLINFFSNKEIKKALKIQNCFLHSSVVFKKESYLKVGGYNSSYKYSQDYNLWHKLSTIGKVNNLEDKLVILEKDINSISSQKKMEQAKYAIISIYNTYILKKPNEKFRDYEKYFHNIYINHKKNSLLKFVYFLYKNKINNNTQLELFNFDFELIISATKHLPYLLKMIIYKIFK